MRVRPQQALDFGVLIGGVPEVVLPNDALRAAQVHVTGEGLSELLVSFLLPSGLAGPGGAMVPLSFGPGAAGYSPDGNIDAQAAFDPDLSEVFALPRNGRGTIYLGGTALPPAQVPSGTYTASITLTISYVGN